MVIKGQIQEIVKNMFKNGDISIYIDSEGDTYEKSVTTKVEVWIDGECVQSERDTAYLE